MLTGLVAFALDISLPAIPTMVRDLATTMSAGQQVVGLFMAGMAVGQVPFGLISDRIGRLPVLYFGIGLFTLAGFVTAFSDDIQVMLIARFVQGVGSSAGMVLARAMVRDVSSGAEAARLMTVMVMVFTAAPMLAPMFGSLLVSVMGWRLPFAATAIAGLIALLGIYTSLGETLVMRQRQHVLVQLWMSVTEFVSHRQSIFGVVVIIFTMSGIMALISGSSALVIQVYDYPVKYFGFIFALTGVGILCGSLINRWLLQRFDALQMIGAGATIAAIAGGQMLLMLWLGEPPFWWIWGNACLYMFGTAFLISNATALALDPVPEIAGVAASIIGTIQSAAGAASAIVSSALYTGTILNVALVIGCSGSGVLGLFLLRRLILGDKPLHGHQP
jgi:DHA1 family bicyclomycin/chloramphenicol resistance-like MFS transporter